MSQTVAPKPAPRPATPPEQPVKPKESLRDTIEQIVVAMILALLIRGFEAEAFVIPTGSMAPTLMGRHKEVTCPQCGFVYAVNASEEEEFALGAGTPRRVDSGVCVNCRFQARRLATTPSFKGDRILVMKFPYELPWLPGASEPTRWDVVVFRYPENPETNYIKRLIGLPGEEIRIQRGDILVRTNAASPFERPDRPLRHQDAMQVTVYDDNHRPTLLADAPEWRRWVPRPEASWKEETPGSFQVAGSDPAAWSELRYRHLVPDPQQWEAIRERSVLPRPPRASLITDFYSYNTNLTADNSDLTGQMLRMDQEAAWMQPHWVGDLTLSFYLQVDEPRGKFRIELVESGVANRCEIDVSTGMATLYHGDRPLGEPADTGINASGRYWVSFANVDNRLTLRVGSRTPFGEGVRYEEDPEVMGPTASDLDPAGVAAQGAALQVSGLVLERDIYYTQDPGRSDYSGLWLESEPRNAVELIEALSDPNRFEALGRITPRDYPIGPDRFMMMGDNSPRSKDSRAWSTMDRLDPDYPDQGWDDTERMKYEVPRSLLIGKAFFIYWPHGKPFGPDIALSPDFRIPFRPYVERMKWIR